MIKLAPLSSFLRSPILIFFYIFTYLIITTGYAQEVNKLSLNLVVNTLALESSQAKILQLNFRNKLLQYENYKKGFLPSITFSFSPFSFNRSLKLLQQPSDGAYTNVEDYSNNSNAGLTLSQKIGLTGGSLTVGSNINYLKEFSTSRSSFSTTPYTIGYSQQIWGGGKTNRYEREIEEKKQEENIKSYCSDLSDIQKESMSLFMSSFLAKLELDLSHKNLLSTDTLLNVAKVRLQNGSFTTYDLRQVELQTANSQYAYEMAQKDYQSTVQKLINFLGIQANNQDIKVEAPVFDLPIQLDSSLVRMYINKNNSYALSEKIKELEAEKDLFTAKISNKLNGNINLNYGVNQYAETMSEAYKKLDSRQSVSVGLQIPIFQWGVNKNKLRMAENTYQISKLETDKNQKEFYNGIIEQINTYNHNVKLWMLAEKTFALSQEQFHLSIQKFSVGRISVYELIAAQQEQSSALQKYYKAVNDAWISYFNLRNATLYDFVSGKELEDVFLEKFKIKKITNQSY